MTTRAPVVVNRLAPLFASRYEGAMQVIQGGAARAPKPWTLESNIKGAQRRELGALVAVSGRNQRGKTAILQAAQLALTGRLPGIKGTAAHPDGNPKQVLEAFAPEGASEVYARLALDGEAHGAYLAWREGKAVKKSWQPPPNRRVPLADADLAEAVRKSGKAAMTLLVETFGEARGLTCPRAATPPMQAEWARALSEEEGLGINPAEADPLTALAEIGSHLGRLKLQLGHEKKRHLRALDDMDPSEWAGIEDLPRLEHQLEEARRKGQHDHEASTRFVAWFRQTEELYARRLAEYQQMAAVTFDAGLQTQLTAARARRAEVEAEARDLRSKVGVNDILLQYLDPTSAHCFLCGSPMDVAGTHRAVGAKLAQRRGELAEAERAAHAAREEEGRLQQALTDAQVAYQTAQQSQANLRAWLEQTQGQIDASRDALAWHERVLGEAWDGPSVTELQAQVRALKEAEARRLAYEEAETKATEAQARQDLVKQLEKLVESDLKRRIADAKARAEAAVQQYMPRDGGLEAVWNDQRLSWEVSAGGASRGLSASGYETHALLFALTVAYAEARASRSAAGEASEAGEVAPAVILLDDEHTTGTFDQAHLRGLMETLGERHADGRVALAAVVLPPSLEDLSCVPEGWDVVTL